MSRQRNCLYKWFFFIHFTWSIFNTFLMVLGKGSLVAHMSVIYLCITKIFVLTTQFKNLHCGKHIAFYRADYNTTEYDMYVPYSFTLVRMPSSWRMTQHDSVIPSLVTPCGLALPETACPPNPAATTEGRRSTSREQDSPCTLRSVNCIWNDVCQKICMISGETNILKVVMFWDLARELLCGLKLKLSLAKFLTCHI